MNWIYLPDPADAKTHGCEKTAHPGLETLNLSIRGLLARLGSRRIGLRFGELGGLICIRAGKRGAQLLIRVQRLPDLERVDIGQQT